MKDLRVLHCPTDTGRNAWGLSRAERKLGIKSDVMVFKSQSFGFPNDIDLHFESRSLLGKGTAATIFFFKSISRYDVFHFNYGMSMLDYKWLNIHYLDFPILKALGKKIIVTFQGCDARIKKFCTTNYEISACAECNDAYGYSCGERLDNIKYKRIEKILKCADKVYALNPDLLHNLPGAEFLPYTNIDLSEWTPIKKPGRTDGLIRILHAPSARSTKGTKYLIEACEKLKRAQYPVELVLIENTTSDQIKDLFQQADMVVDQLLVGWYGGLSVEAMALEKPVVCYLRQEDLDRFIPFKEKIPVINTTIDTLYKNLISLIENPGQMIELGKKGRRYVEEIHDPIKIAQKLIEVYRG